MSKRHQRVAKAKKTRTGQHRKRRHKTTQALNHTAQQHNRPKPVKPPKKAAKKKPDNMNQPIDPAILQAIKKKYGI